MPAEMGAFSPWWALVGWMLIGSTLPDGAGWPTAVSRLAGIVCLVAAAMMALGGWWSIWDALGELNAQAEERRRRESEPTS